ncbi:hypothetical protein WJX77_011783 [Trebouxia sp. C0004]
MSVQSAEKHDAELQVPRLSGMLRAFTTQQGSVDIPAQYRQRTLELESRRLRAGNSQTCPLGSSKFAQQLIGPWLKAPKSARQAYEQYILTVAGCLGGEPSSPEIQEAAVSVWDALQDAPPPAKLQQGRTSISAAVKPYRDALEKVVGTTDDKAVLSLLDNITNLKGWQLKLVPVEDGPSKALTKAISKAVPQQPLPAKEYGADLPFRQPTPDRSADDVVLALCSGHGVNGAVPADDRHPSGHEPSVQSLKQMFASHTATKASTSSNSKPALIAEDDELDLDPEYAPKRALTTKVGARWLSEWCHGAGASHATAGSSDDAFALAVSRVLLASKSVDEAAAELFDLLGDGSFDAIQQLLEHRQALATNLRRQIQAFRAEDIGDKSAMPSYGTVVSVTSNSQKMLEKLERKDKRRGAKGKAMGDPDLEWLASYGFDVLVEAEVEKATAHQTITLATGTEFRIGQGDGSTQVKGALPKGTARKSMKGYEEVSVPAVRPAAPPPGEELIKITDMEEWAQLAFAGYKTLNRIQSRIYPTALNSNQNLLVCAPTGAGKTNIAMLAVLHEVGQNMRHGIIQKQDFKVVYVAPMKALAAEVTAAFSRRLGPLGLKVAELTGDMQLSKKELAETQMIVTTPEKWDVITRKGGDVSVAATVRLLIIDEVHLLNDERGPVIETLIARTQRQVEASQSMIRIVGLSATLPNYKDVASFLGVTESGMFYFDASYRPVPLAMQFIGATDKNIMASKNVMDEVCFMKIVDSLQQGHQAMVFVHSRKDTGKTGRTLALKAQQEGKFSLFDCREHPKYGLMAKDVKKSRNKEVQELFESGIGIHHAGMLRSDRNLVERLFGEGLLKVLCCTATLAWGVNLPAHTVIIKGTQLYDAQKGAFTELGMLDVQQIFGRAGRPQFEDEGLGIIITQHAQLAHYLGMLTHQSPIESKFTDPLVDNLNAEIVLGTVTNVREASLWLSYTYLFVRMLRNPLAYGVGWEELTADPRLEGRRKTLVSDAARELEKSKMARFDEKSGNLYVTELGRVASHFYIRHSSIVIYNDLLKRHMSEAELLYMMAQSSEFGQMAIREEELPELDTLARDACHFDIKGGPENKHGKVNILLQAYVSRARVESFSLIADMMYVSSNAPRIARSVFEICLRRGWSSCAELALTLCKAFELRLWPHQHPLRQFEGILAQELLFKLEDRGLWMERLQDMEPSEIGSILRHPAMGKTVQECVNSFPSLYLDAQLQPITRTVLRVQLSIEPTFQWKDRAHGNGMRWHIWVEDSENEHIYHSETWLLTKKMMHEPAHTVAFTIPIFEPLPPQYYIRAVSDSWLGAEAFLTVSFKNLILPERHPPHTELLDLDPLPLSALNNPTYQAMYSFSHFNPLQTQAFHALYHTDENVLLGAPTGSGKTISAELAMLRVFNHYPGQKIIYIAPLKALVRERMNDWGKGLCARLGKKMVELTGDYTPDLRALLSADIIICTPEKWDGISRNWQNRTYVQKVCLLVIDEIHLLGADRGPILEVIVSRMRYISAQTDLPIRFLGLSTALANAADLADWLGIKKPGLFNFKPSVRPVPLECHIQGYPGKFYCPRMATMNKPAYAAIQTHSPLKPVLIFVSSRRQTRLTALDLIGYAAGDERPRQFVHLPEQELDQELVSIKDPNLRHTLQFGIGMHHAGLTDGDRTTCERLFVAGKIQILVATSTLAWGVNTPAHLVVIKGTEYFDAPSRRYVDFPITDVLQMMGRAGRPQYDRQGVAVIMVHDPKKSFYKKFLYEPFPVESSLLDQVSDHFNAEAVAGTIGSKQDAVDYMTWTFLYRRLLQNPSYYNLEGTTAEDVNEYLSALVERTFTTLLADGCISIGENDEIESMTMGRICSFYYLKHQTMGLFATTLKPEMDFKHVLHVLCGVTEYDELPVRHNEDKINTALAGDVRWPTDTRSADDPHTKANLLLQAHMSRLPAPISDYVTDTKSVLDQSLRILQAMTDVSADAGWLDTALVTMMLVQSLMQGCWGDQSSLMMLPNMTPEGISELASKGFQAVPQLCQAASENAANLRRTLTAVLGSSRESSEVMQVLERLPVVDIRWRHPHLIQAKPKGLEEGTPGQEYQLDVQLRRVGGKKAGNGLARVFAPRFPKVKEEGWWLVLGDVNTHELLALKRISFADHTTARLTFPVVNGAGKEMTGVTLFFMSDSYLGLDQQYLVPVVAKQQGNQLRHGQTGQQHSNQQQRHAHNGPQQVK